MGWKVRSGKLALVKQKGGTTQQVRFAIAKDKIKQALAASGKALEDGLDIEDFQDLAQNGILINNPQNSQIGEMEKLKKHKVSLEEIKDYFTDKYTMDLKAFIDIYLNIKDNSSSTLNKFMAGKIGIKKEVFKTICNVLELDYHEIGMEDEPEMPDSKQLESLLWDLNHRTQVADFQALAQKSHNLVCLKFRSVPWKKIPMFWLLKTLVQQVDNSIQKAEIIFSTQIYSDSTDRLNNIITGLRLPKNLRKRKSLTQLLKKFIKKY